MTGRHARAARALVGWTQSELAKRAKIGTRTVARIEKDEEVSKLALAAVARAFEDAGIRIFSHASEIQLLDIDTGIAIVAARS